MASAQTSFDSEQTVVVYRKADSEKALGIEDGKAKFLDYKSTDQTQQWRKIVSESNPVGSFVLVNKDKSKAISQPSVVGQEVVLVDYPIGNLVDVNLVLWTEGEDEESGFECICVANNTTLIWEVGQDNLSIKVVTKLPPVKPTDDQLWKLSTQIVTVCSKAYPGQALKLDTQANKLKFDYSNPNDAAQQWVKILKKDDQAFALVNKAAWTAISQPSGEGQEVKLVKYEHLTSDLLWTESDDKGDGYKATIEIDANISLDVDNTSAEIKVVVHTSNAQKTSQLWKISPCT